MYEPISKEKAEEMVERLKADALENGVWAYVCSCGQICGGHLAGFGKPKLDPYIACPICGKSNSDGSFTLEFQQ